MGEPREQVVAKPTLPGIPAQRLKNLVWDPDFSDIEGNWKLVFTENASIQEYARESVILPNGQAAQALRVTTDQGCRITIKRRISADPGKAYRFSLWVKQDPVEVGSRYFGFFAYDGRGNAVDVVTKNGKEENNPYFWNGTPRDGNWRHLVGYLFQASRSLGWSDPEDTSRRNFKSSPGVARLVIRFLNYYNGGTTVSAQFALPQIEEVSVKDLTSG